MMREIDNIIFKDEFTFGDFIKLREAFPVVDTEDEMTMARMQLLTLQLLCDDKTIDFEEMPLSRVVRISSAMGDDIKKKTAPGIPAISATPTLT